MKKNKILFVHANNHEIGGADYCLFKMTFEMNRLGYETLVLLSKRTSIVELYEKNGLSVIVKPILRIQKTINPIRLFGYIFSFSRSLLLIIKVIKQNHINIVHSNDLLDFTANIAAKITGVISIQHVRMIVKGLLKVVLSRISLYFSDQVLAVSFGLKQTMFGPEEQKVKVLYDWIDIDLVEHQIGNSNLRVELNISDDIKIIGCVGRLESWKGQHIFIEAALEVLRKYEKCVFVIVGGTVKGKESYLKELKNLVRTHKIEEKVFFLGERKDVANLFSQFNLSVHSSIEPDPFPGVVLESLVNGCVIIGANGGGVPEEIDEDITGLLYEPGNHKELSEHIFRLLSDDDKLNKLKINTRRVILTKFDKHEIIKRLDSIYSTLLEQK
ncbi:glycosyltransferase family 4 protein [Candidatus Nomurabacteria bacterium]|nr:glycosyltransferase family 4 protein [Candidatus Nomurabacteria bacterium]